MTPTYKILHSGEWRTMTFAQIRAEVGDHVPSPTLQGRLKNQHTMDRLNAPVKTNPRGAGITIQYGKGMR